MRKAVEFLLVVAAMASGTWFVAWWAVPVAAALWALARPRERGLALMAGVAGMLAWIVVLVLASPAGSIGRVATVVGTAMGVGSTALLVLMLAYPALLGSSAAALVRALTAGRRLPTLLALTLTLGACQTGDDTAQSAQAVSTGSALADSVGTAAIGSLPPIGIAVADTGRAWCAALGTAAATPALKRGRAVMIVFAGPATVPARAARVRGKRAAECPSAFAQPRWTDYVSYDLEITDSLPSGGAEMPIVALFVASVKPWVRGADGVVRTDLDGDGQPEEARRCTAGEGEHLTLWTVPAGGVLVRRWHEYFDWGALTEPTCQRGEDGTDRSVVDRQGFPAAVAARSALIDTTRP